MDLPETITVKGSGGALFDMDVPAEGTQARELFEQKLANQELVWLDDEGRRVPIDQVGGPDVDDPDSGEEDGEGPDVEEVLDASVDDVKAWIDEDPAERAPLVLEVEPARDKPRKGVLAYAEEVLEKLEHGEGGEGEEGDEADQVGGPDVDES